MPAVACIDSRFSGVCICRDLLVLGFSSMIWRHGFCDGSMLWPPCWSRLCVWLALIGIHWTWTVFYGASVFNSNVSDWNTGAVTNMHGSKSFIACCCFSCVVATLSFLLLWLMPFLTLRNHSPWTPHFCFPCSLVCVVFRAPSAFNSDISKWNTGAVTTIALSKSFVAMLFLFCGHSLLLIHLTFTKYSYETPTFVYPAPCFLFVKCSMTI